MFALLFVSFALCEVPLLGIPPKLRSQYLSSIDESAGTFRCLDGSKTIPLSQFNDNYRDCPDASDEPGTSDGPSTPFYCENRGYVPVTLPRWAVGDGICDCCDGSDEPAGVCQNTCDATEKERRVVMEQLRSVYADGLKKKAKLVREGNNIMSNRKRQVAEYEAEMNKCERKIQVLENIKTTRPSPTPSPTAEATPEATVEPSATEEEVVDEEQVEDDGVPEDVVVVEGKNPDADSLSAKQNPSAVRTAFIKAWQVMFRIPPEDNPYLLEPMPLQEQRDRISKLRDRVRELEKLIKEMDEIDSTTHGQLPPEMVPLFGKEFKDGDYELQLFKKVKQKYTSCGDFKKYGNGIAKFHKGGHCWQTKKGRKSVVKLICSNKNKIVSAMEPSTCKYSFVFATPAICSEESFNALYNMSLPELVKVKEELGM